MKIASKNFFKFRQHVKLPRDYAIGGFVNLCDIIIPDSYDKRLIMERESNRKLYGILCPHCRSKILRMIRDDVLATTPGFPQDS